MGKQLIIGLGFALTLVLFSNGFLIEGSLLNTASISKISKFSNQFSPRVSIDESQSWLNLIENPSPFQNFPQGNKRGHFLKNKTFPRVSFRKKWIPFQKGVPKISNLGQIFSLLHPGVPNQEKGFPYFQEMFFSHGIFI